MTNQTVALGTVEPDPAKQASDNVPGSRVLRVVGIAGSAQRQVFWNAMGRRVAEAAVLFLVVAAMAQSWWLALAVTAADLALRPVADRVAAWCSGHLWHGPVFTGGQAD